MSTATKDEAGWLIEHSTDRAGEKTITFHTENTFIDADARIVITTPSAGQPTLELNNINTELSMGSASNGTYTPTATFTGSIVIDNAGWMGAGYHAASDSGVAVGTVNQSTITVDQTATASGATITPNNSSKTITISEGYNGTRTLTVAPVSAGPKAEVTSGSATINAITYSYSSTNSNFTVSGSGNVSAPTVGTAGYISSSEGTKNVNNGGATVSAPTPKIAIQANLSGTGTKVPVISADTTKANIPTMGTATTTKPNTGYYVAVASPANTGTVSATASVTTAGYGTTTTGQYTTTPSSALTVGAEASLVTYVPVGAATFANAATSGVSYTDISATGPILVSGDYLYINAGYTPNQKISLARLIPDAQDANASAAYILDGYTAFNNDGTLIIGTMQAYNGDYTVT